MRTHGYVCAYYYIGVRILLYRCPHSICVSSYYYMSSYYYICVLMMYMSIYYYICVIKISC